MGNALGWACESGKLEIVKWMVGNSAILRLDKNELSEAMTIASYNSCRGVVRWMVKHTTVENTFVYDKGNTVLHYVICCDINNGSTRLHMASSSDNVAEVCRLVYVYGDSVNVQNNYGDTALHIASRYGYIDVVAMLMSVGADETITNDEGHSSAQRVTRGYRNRGTLLQLLDKRSVKEEAIDLNVLM